MRAAETRADGRRVSPGGVSAGKEPPAAAFWREELPELLARLEAADAGLSDSAASSRRARHGPNVLAVRRGASLPRLLLSRFRNPLVLLLLVASAISALTGDLTSAILVAVIALLSVTLDAVQEFRAGRAAERLRQSVAIRVTTLRDGRQQEIPATDLVPGDVVLLSAGALVPADGRLLAGRDCFVNQALLTGEPYPVEKHPEQPPAPDLTMSEALNSLFMGTSVVSGTARLLVCRTGAATALGEIGASLDQPPPPSAFEIGTRRFGFLIMRLAVGMVLFVILVNSLEHRPILQSFLFAVALAVGLTPELLPMVVSVTLARGALRMAAKKVIVKRLAAIHDLGSMDILCTDKTGTLTEASIRLEKHLDPSGESSPRVLELAYLNSFFATGVRTPMDDAILRHRAEVDVAGWSKLDEVPFDFERRRVSVLLRRADGSRLLLIKGALEEVLRLSIACETGGAVREIGEAERRSMSALFERLGGEGFRVLGIASRAMPADGERCAVSDERGLVFAGFAAFEDPPKASTRAALRDLAACGVAVKVVTGDNEMVTRHVCAEVGLPIAAVLTGAEIEGLDDLALEVRAAAATLFCRVAPAEKNRIILALKRRGHVVGYLGDGINDAPSLHSADVAISVDSGVDVAKESADLILLEQDLGVLHQGVLEGRRTFGNIMKYIMMGTSSNFGNMFSMAGASLFLPFLPMLPVQVLLNNLLYDVSEVPIPMDTVDDDFMLRPRRWDVAFIRNFMIFVGPVSSIFDFLTFFVMLRVFHAGEALFHTGWFIESLATQVLVIFIIRTRGNPLRSSRPSRLLTAASLAVVAAGALLPFTPLAAKLGFVPPPASFFLILAGMVAVYLSGVQVVKLWFYRHFFPEP